MSAHCHDYQLELDASIVSPNNYTNSTCVFAGLPRRSFDRNPGTTPHSGLARPQPFTLILGAELAPGLYKLRLWSVCAIDRQSARVRRVAGNTGADLIHRQRAAWHSGSAE